MQTNILQSLLLQKKLRPQKKNDKYRIAFLFPFSSHVYLSSHLSFFSRLSLLISTEKNSRERETEPAKSPNCRNNVGGTELEKEFAVQLKPFALLQWRTSRTNSAKSRLLERRRLSDRPLPSEGISTSRCVVTSHRSFGPSRHFVHVSRL